MTDKEDQTPADGNESDGGETEDEEVKRNCIMGESGMRDSDYFDSDTDMEEEETEDQVHEESKESLDEDRIEELVKFVSVGSQILKAKGLTLCRPTPIVLVTAMHGDRPDESDESSSDSSPKINLSVSHDDSTSGFSPRSKTEGEVSPSSSSSQDSDSDSNDGDVESIDSDDDAKTSSFHFPFGEGVELSLEIGSGIASTAPVIDESLCKSSFDEQEEANEEYALVGASGASVDDKWQMPKQKRVLSSTTLSTLNQEAGRDESPAKKPRLSEPVSQVECAIPEITLCTEALDEIIQPLPRQYLVRDDSSLVHSSSDEEEDRVLSEELEEKFRCKRISVANFPIPLLTPPQSPRTVDSSMDDDELRSIEWPSNLVMDSTIIENVRKTGPRIRTISVECRDRLR